MKNPHIIFKSIEGKIKAGVVELPIKKHHQCVDFEDEKCHFCRDYEDELKQAIANPIFFKEEKDEKQVERILMKQEFKDKNYAHSGYFFELDKPYKIEEEIEVREMSKSKDLNDSFWEDIKLPRHQIDFHKIEIKKFAFIKQPEEQPEPFDGSAELDTPEEAIAKIANRQEKEEGQDELVHDLMSGFQLTMKDYSRNFERIKSEFTITRKS